MSTPGILKQYRKYEHHNNLAIPNKYLIVNHAVAMSKVYQVID